MVFLKKKVFVVDTNFVVFITKKETNKNTAFLAILNSQASDDETIKDLPHINLFDEKEIKEVISNPVILNIQWQFSLLMTKEKSWK